MGMLLLSEQCINHNIEKWDILIIVWLQFCFAFFELSNEIKYEREIFFGIFLFVLLQKYKKEKYGK